MGIMDYLEKFYGLMVLSTMICILFIKDNIKNFSLTFIYCFPHQHLQKQLWEQVEKLHNACNNPRLILGGLKELQTTMKNYRQTKTT